MIFFRELNSNLLVANDKIIGLSHEGACGSLGGKELDDGEPLDGSIVGTLLVLVFRDVDVTDGTVLLKDASEFIGVDVTGQIACNDRLHSLWIVKGLRVGRENG